MKLKYIKAFSLNFLLCLTFSFGTIAQTPRDNMVKDSLLKRLPKATENEKISIYNKLGEILIIPNLAESEKLVKKALTMAIQKNIPVERGFSYHLLGRIAMQQNDFLKAKKNFEKSIEIKKSIGDHEGASKSLNQIGIILQGWGKNDDALKYYEQSFNEAKEAKYIRGMAIAMNQQANVFNLQSKFDLAIKKYQQALTLFEQLENMDGIISTNNNIGYVYSTLEKWKDAIKYYKQALYLALKYGNDKKIGESYNNIGVIFSQRDTTGNNNELTNPDSAKKYFELAKKYFTKAQYFQGITSNLHNLSMIYFNKKDYTNAIKTVDESIVLAKQLNNKYELALGYQTLGLCFSKTGNFAKAIENFNISLKIAQETHLLDIEVQAFQHMSGILAADNKFKSAYEHLYRYSTLKDSLKGEQVQKVLQEMETKYQTAQKEQQIKEANIKNEAQQKQNEAQQKQLIFLAVFFIVVFLFAVFAVWQFLQKRKANRLLSLQNIEISRKNEEIEAQRNQVMAQRDLIEEQQKGIMDSIHYASRIQRAILPSEEYIFDLLGDRFFVLYKPRDIVSGDFYWIGNRNNKVIVVAADCTGHGVPGAFMSMLGTAFLNEITSIMSDDLHPSKILDILRDYIITSLKQTGKQGEQKDGMDLAMYIFDEETKKIEFAGANNPLFIVRRSPEILEPWEDGRISQEIFENKEGEKCALIHIKADKMPIGIYSETRPFESLSFQLHDGDTLYNFSDGYVDQFGGPDNKKFLTKRFKKLLVEINKMKIDDQQDIIDKAIEDWKAGREQVDDILVMGFRV